MSLPTSSTLNNRSCIASLIADTQDLTVIPDAPSGNRDLHLRSRSSASREASTACRAYNSDDAMTRNARNTTLFHEPTISSCRKARCTSARTIHQRIAKCLGPLPAPSVELDDRTPCRNGTTVKHVTCEVGRTAVLWCCMVPGD
jgi:hypothetical protein